MATTTGEPSIGNTLVDAITNDRIWAVTDLQYLLGGSDALTFDSYFQSDYSSAFRGLPDSVFAFTALAQRAYTLIDSLCNLDFTQTTDTAVADFVLVSNDNSPRSTLEGFFEFPETTTRPGSTTDYWSLGAFNSGLDYMMKAGEVGGGEYANWTVIHEIGHGLGLLHTHQERRGLPPLPEVGAAMDNERYSVMSYNGASNGIAYGHAVSMMALDVAALQALYGAEAYGTGNSTYTMFNAKAAPLSLVEGNVDIGRAYFCIWDSGGTDRIDYGSSGKSVMINLNDATLDTSGISAELSDLIDAIRQSAVFKALTPALKAEIVDEWHHAGGFFSRVLDFVNGKFRGIDGGFSIANGAVIENAVGGDRGDLLIGNEGDNQLTGLAGRDTLLGSTGNDTLDGGDNNDRLDGGEGNDTLTGGLGMDLFVFRQGGGTDTITDHGAGDRIDLTDFGFANVGQVTSLATDTGSDIEIDFATGDTLIIRNVELADLTFVL